MKKHNESNERVKRDYFAYLKEARSHSDQTIDSVAMAISRFETHTKFRDFKSFHQEQAIAFKRNLAEQLSQRGEGKLSKSTVRATLAALRNFFIWLAGRPGFRSRLTYADADYFNASDRDTRIALATRPRPVPSLEQVIHVLAVMPDQSILERRDRALIAFILLTGCRVRAAVSLKMKHVDLALGRVFQDAREVHTKRGKSITTYFFPVGELPLRIVTEWIAELQTAHLWGPDDPLFPRTRVEQDHDAAFRATGIERRHWRNADPVRRIFRAAFTTAGLAYYRPHNFRHTLARLGLRLCRTPEQIKAWSQNHGHDQVLTTLISYSRIEEHRQGEIIQDLARAPASDADERQRLEQIRRLASP